MHPGQLTLVVRCRQKDLCFDHQLVKLLGQLQLTTLPAHQTFVDLHDPSIVAAACLIVLVELRIHTDRNITGEYPAITEDMNVLDDGTRFTVDATIERMIDSPQCPRGHFGWSEIFIDITHGHDHAVFTYPLTDVGERFVDFVRTVQVQEDALLASTTDVLAIGGGCHPLQEILSEYEAVLDASSIAQEDRFGTDASTVQAIAFNSARVAQNLISTDVLTR